MLAPSEFARQLIWLLVCVTAHLSAALSYNFYHANQLNRMAIQPGNSNYLCIKSKQTIVHLDLKYTRAR